MTKSASSDRKVAQVIAIASGKGGVGKTSLTINLGIALSQLGRKVCLFDADSNLANINIMLRLMPEYTMEHVLRGDKSVQDIIVNKAGVSLIPGATGLTQFVKLPAAMQKRMISTLKSLEQNYDHMLVDTAAGISEQVLSFIETAHQCLLVVSPEPTSLTDAFSLLRVLKRRGYDRAVNLVVNYAQAELSARKVFNRFSAAVAKYIGYQVRYLGFVLKDDFMSSAISLQHPIVLQKPGSPASRSLIRLAGAIDRLAESEPHQPAISESFSQKCSEQVPDLAEQVAVPAAEAAPAAAEQDYQQHDEPDPEYTRRQILRDHGQALREMIEDPDTSRLELRGVLNDLVDVYVSRFNDYPFDVTRILNHALEMDKVPQNKLSQLMMTLQLFYRDHLSQADKEISGEYLRQLVNSYVEEHKAYPFDVVYTLYKYLDLASVPEQQMRELLTNLHLVYEDKYRVSRDQDDSEPLLYCMEHEQEEYEKVVALLQDKHLHNLAQKMKQHTPINDHNNGADGPAKEKAGSGNALLDSIRFASLTD